MRAKARWRASSWRWYFDTALIMGSVSGCSLASFCKRSGTSSPLSTSRQNSDGMPVRNGMSDLLRDAADRAVEGVPRLRLHLVEEAHEEAGVAGLLPHLVQQVRHPGVGEVGAGEDVDAESSHQDRLEADAGVHDGCELLPGQGALLLVGEPVEELGDVGQGEELVGEDLAVADLAGDVGVGLHDALQGGGREALDALLDGPGGLGAVGASLCVHGRSHARILHESKHFVKP